MKQRFLLGAVGALLCLGAAHAADKPVRFILVGDSTMASNSGYGEAFCARVNRAHTCINLAKGGRSSSSFRAEGRWDEVQGLLKGSAAYRATYVLIQFGHNDQPGKPGRSTDLKTEFPVNMARYVDEVKALNGLPVLVTPLTRRSFKEGVLENTLVPWADAIRATAKEKQVPLLDLNADSYAAVQAMGEAQADTFAVAPKPASAPVATGTGVEPQGAAKSAFDYTHLGAKGAKYFAAMVEGELKTAIPALAAEFKPEGE
ncbi:rhamnogalacturonan acetylesterase [Pseudoduganella umbonata]|uniref:Lysophospholipase L1-like esterase n=1 Tax=Pseudoduganella umbonata TaxID=864828 RepID=A0A4P8HSY8_9BURK|nr:rhamnogalacturonan acetylesterase [Pseudoduganella umbonata]MBB3220759.1 lysophospholipase L1-like esterase [Pseudoduganella umbonata]QCP11768.1 rhamnogalacturonan acetylesterase [Pseudoduganella umbonata]